MAYNFEIGKSYTFNTLAPAQLGIAIKNAKLLAIMDYDMALTFENIELKYRKVYPLLPNGTPETPKNILYYRFLTESNEKIIIAAQWIDETTVALITAINFKVSFTGGSIQDKTTVRNALNALGYTNFIIEDI